MDDYTSNRPPLRATWSAQDPEDYRRETPTMRTEPIRAEIVDYSTAGLHIDKAMHHLNEALPIGQRMRAESSMRLLRRGVEELAVWMRARGYDV